MDHIGRFGRLDKLGSGTYGQVYKAIDYLTNQIVVIKTIKETNPDNGLSSSTTREIVLLRSLSDHNHENIVKILQIVMEGSIKCHLIFEYVDSDLQKYIASNGALPSLKVKSFSRQIIKGLAFCHSHGIMHRLVS